MDLERERGITIQAQAVRIYYTAADGQTYELNLIDTPGHVDFSYEVSRSLAACEGALLVVDACQGIQAQTLANAYLAIEGDLELIPVLNKIDLPAAEPELHGRAVAELVGEDADRVLRISAKTGQGVDEVLEAIVERVPPPAGDPSAPARALIFDSVYDQYRGVVAFARVVDGAFRQGDRLRAMQTGLVVEAEEIGATSPAMTHRVARGGGDRLPGDGPQEDRRDLRVGDTLTRLPPGGRSRCPVTREVKPMVFCGLFPVATPADDYPDLRDALEKLSLNDASLRWVPSQALGFGFRCGFLGLLHMEIVRERLEARVRPRAAGHDAEGRDGHRHVRRPPAGRSALVGCRRPPASRSSRSRTCAAPDPRPPGGRRRKTGLCQDRRVFATMEPIEHRQQVVYDLPLAEIVLDLLLRPAEVADARVRLARLRDRAGYRESPAGQARRAARRRDGPRAL